MLKRSLLLIAVICISLPSLSYAQPNQKFTFVITLKTVDNAGAVTLLDAWTAFGFDNNWRQVDGTMPAAISATQVYLSGGPTHSGMFGENARQDFRLSPNPAGALVFGGGIVISAAQGPIQADVLSKAISEKCRAIISADNSMSREQRATRIQQLDEQLTKLNQQVSALNVLASAYMQNGPADQRLGERIKQLRTELQRLDADLSAKEARRKALQVGMKEQEERLKIQQNDDAIAEELRKLLFVREREVAQLRELRKQDFAADSQVQAAENAVTEARIRLLERKATISKAGKGELLDRLADETAMISVDMTELEIKRANVKSQLSSLDPAVIESGKIDQALKENPELRAENSRTMLANVIQKRDAAIRERFALLVNDISVSVTPEPAQP